MAASLRLFLGAVPSTYSSLLYLIVTSFMAARLYFGTMLDKKSPLKNIIAKKKASTNVEALTLLTIAVWTGVELLYLNPSNYKG